MAKDGNKVHMTARLGADPEMKYTAQGKAVTELRVAVAGAGNTFEDAGWFSCTAWEKLAEICNQYLTKGSRVYIEGRLQVQSWEDKNGGGNRSKVVIVLTDMVMLDSKPSTDSANNGNQQPAERPQAQSKPATRTPARNVPSEIDDGPLPF